MKILLRLLGYASRYRLFTVLAYLCLLGSTGLNLVQPLIIQQVIDRGIGQGEVTVLYVASVLLVVVNVTAGVLSFGMSYLNEFVSQRVAYDLRNNLYDHLQRLSFAYHDRSRTGELMSRVTSDVDAARVFTGQGVLQIVNTVVLYVSVLALMFFLNWQLALLSLITLPFLAVTAIQYGTRVRPLFSRMQRQWAQLTAVLQENVTGVRVVKAFAREDFEIAKFERENQVYLERNIAATRLQALVYPLMLFITSVGTIAIIWFGGQQVMAGALTLGTLLAFSAYLARLAQPTRMLGFIIAWISRATASGERLFEILDAKSPVEYRPGAPPLRVAEGRVTFDHVSFAYGQPSSTLDGAAPVVQPVPSASPRPGSPPPPARGGRRTPRQGQGGLVLQDITFEAEPDQVVALLGHTGAGKTSLVALIPRFYDVTAGAVRIDGQDVREVDLQSLRRQIGIVMQESLLFSASVAENIAYGDPGASMERIVRAARAAQAFEFISELPEGFETKIGERGVTLSGGQRQRLAIARALLIDPRILILDDATASVDMRTEFQIQRALQELMKGRTTFVIAQRLSTIKQADQILVLEHGRIVQRGRHDDLVAQPGPYREIYDLQLRDQEEVLRQMPGRDGACPAPPPPPCRPAGLPGSEGAMSQERPAGGGRPAGEEEDALGKAYDGRIVAAHLGLRPPLPAAHAGRDGADDLHRRRQPGAALPDQDRHRSGHRPGRPAPAGPHRGGLRLQRPRLLAGHLRAELHHVLGGAVRPLQHAPGAVRPPAAPLLQLLRPHGSGADHVPHDGGRQRPQRVPHQRRGGHRQRRLRAHRHRRHHVHHELGAGGRSCSPCSP